MPKKKLADDAPKPEHQSIIAQGIVGEMESAYLDYAMSVITQRA